MLDTKGNRVTYFGHSTFSLTTPTGKTALIDPWVMTNPVCPAALKKLGRLDAIFLTNPVCPAALKKLGRLDAIFLTHSHSDHMGDLLELAKQHRPKIVAIFGRCCFASSSRSPM